MRLEAGHTERRLRRLVDELVDAGFDLEGTKAWKTVLLPELDYALRPPLHERRIPSFGAIIEPDVDASQWEAPSHLEISHRPVAQPALSGARMFADGISSWVVVRTNGEHELVVFDRPAGSERDLVVLAEATGSTLVQRHPSGMVRMVGTFGVLRWDRLRWHHEPPVSAWIDAVSACGVAAAPPNHDVLETLLEFAVHDLGSRGIGATLVYRPDDGPGPRTYQIRLPEPPPVVITRATDLAPLRHVLGQVDGATIFDASGTLRQLGVRLVPSAEAESEVAGYRGMRHTSGRRYSFDDPTATVVVVSEDGPVTVLRNGLVLGSSQGSGPLAEMSAGTES
jgi:hypothetical protein